jgi:DHA1 family multidrug resistance protein-like MFS transporter
MLGDWLGILRLPHMLRILSIRLLVRTGWLTLRPFLPLFVATLLASQASVSTVTGLAAGISSAFCAIGSVLLGRIGDRIGHRQLLVACSLGAAAGYVSVTVLVTQAWQLVVLYSLIGGLLGGIIPSMDALMTRAAPDGQMGSVYGLGTSVTSIGRMIVPLLLAALIALVGVRSVFLPAAIGFALVAVLAASHRSLGPPLRNPSDSPAQG